MADAFKPAPDGGYPVPRGTKLKYRTFKLKKVRLRGTDVAPDYRLIREDRYDETIHDECVSRAVLKRDAGPPIFGTETRDALLTMTLAALKEKPEWREVTNPGEVTTKEEIVDAILEVREV